MLFARGEISTPPMERYFLGEPTGTAPTHRQGIYLPWCTTQILTAASQSHHHSFPRCLCTGFERSTGSASCPSHVELCATPNLPTCHWGRMNLQEND